MDGRLLGATNVTAITFLPGSFEKMIEECMIHTYR